MHVLELLGIPRNSNFSRNSFRKGWTVMLQSHQRKFYFDNVPWINIDIIEAKRQRRKAERKWRTARCQYDRILFKKRRNYVTFLMNKARQDYYSDLISSNGDDLRHLSKVSKNLLNITSTPVLPPHEDQQQLANAMGTLFNRKIANIHSDRDNHSPQVCRVGSSECNIDLTISKLICYVRRRCMIWSVHPQRRLVPWHWNPLPFFQRAISTWKWK